MIYVQLKWNEDYPVATFAYFWLKADLVDLIFIGLVLFDLPQSLNCVWIVYECLIDEENCPCMVELELFMYACSEHWDI